MTRLSAVLQHLPAVARGRVCAYQIDEQSRVVSRAGSEEDIEFRVAGGGIDVLLAAERRCQVRRIAGVNEWGVVTYDAVDEAAAAPFVEILFELLSEKEQVELDMESMYSSSLALLEEVSMVGEMLPQLPTGESDIEVARMGLEALLVAASVGCAIFVRLDETRRLAEVLVYVGVADDEPGPRVMEYPGDQFILESDSIVWRALQGSGSAILESAPETGHLGAPGSPESLARRQIIAVPVRYGAGDKSVTLGALLMMDKCANAYSNTTEFGSQDTKLTISVAAMLGSVLGTRKVAELGNEMRTAQALQQQILPNGAPIIAGYDMAGRCTTSGAVGGDYYDFLHLPDGRMMVVVADVSGHNLASGMVMVSARTSLRLLASTISDPGQMFDALAAALFDDLLRTERFITATGVTLRSGSKKIEIVSAGHNPTMLFHAATGEITEVRSEETVFGFLAEPRHTVRELELAEGDVVLLYTDGVTEAVNPEGEMFEEDRLRQVLSDAAAGGADEILSAVFGAVGAFADKSEKGDDVSAVVIKVT